MARSWERWLGRAVSMMAGGSAVVAAVLAIWIFFDLSNQSGGAASGRLLAAAIFLIAIATIAVFMAVQIWRSPTAPKAVGLLAPEHQWVAEDFWSDVVATDEWPESCAGEWWWREVERAATADPGQSLGELQRLTGSHPGSVRFSGALIRVLTALDRVSEARDEVLRITRQVVREGTRTALWSVLLDGPGAGKTPEALEASLSQCVERLSDRGKALMLDAAACRCFMREDPGPWLSLADRLSSQAVSSSPGLMTIQGTRGSVLAELGHDDEATALLEPVYRGAKEGINRGYSALYLAVVASRRGEAARARRLAREALRQPIGDYAHRRLAAAGL